MPESRVWVDTTPTGLQLTLQLPLNRLEYSFGKPLADVSRDVLPQYAEGLSQYLLQHVGARSSGVGWQVQRPQLEVVGTDASAELQAVLELRAPAGADLRSPTLLYDAITHEVRTHRVLVFLRNDWSGGFVGQAPLPLGELHHGLNSLQVPLEQARPRAGLLRLFKGGATHIAEGADHLLFLLLLLVISPVIASGRRWTMARPAGAALRQLATVVTAFTVGHSVTLALGSTGLLTPPSQIVEVAVAVSIAIAALHAMRPLFASGEVAMALVFGLVHGFAFSASLSGAGLTAGQHALALLAFNLGIEAMQLLLVVAVMPPLLMLCRLSVRGYAMLRRIAAGTGFVLALLWIVERSGLAPIDTTPWFEATTRAVPLVIAVEWLTVAALLGTRRLLARAPAMDEATGLPGPLPLHAAAPTSSCEDDI